MDMAGIHCTQALWSDVMGGDPDIRIIYNLPYRPDFNGIEVFWAAAKRDYRSRLDWIKANGKSLAQVELVQECVEGVDDIFAKRFARAGWIRLFKGQPVVPLVQERMPFPGDPVLEQQPDRQQVPAAESYYSYDSSEPTSDVEEEEEEPQNSQIDLDGDHSQLPRPLSREP